MNSDSVGLLLGLATFVLIVVLYVWQSLALAALFRKAGEQSWKGWVPILNQATVLQLGGFSPWLILVALIPGVGGLVAWVLLIVAAHRINRDFGYGAGMTVLAALLFIIWASVLGFGSARWIGAGAAPTPGPARRGPDAVPTPSAAPAPAAVAPPATAPHAPETARVTLPSPAPGATAPAASATSAWAPAAAPSFGPPASPPPIPPRPLPTVGPSAADPGDDDADAVDPGDRVPGRSPSAAPAAPAPVAPIASVPGIRPSLSGPNGAGTPVAPVHDVPAPPAAPASPQPDAAPAADADASREPEPEPWAPPPPALRSPAPAADDTFPELSEAISAVAGAPDAGAPRSARASVSALYAQPEIPADAPAAAASVDDDPADDADDDDLEALDRTVIARRRRIPWALIPPGGSPIELASDVVILGRRPAADPAHPGAQLIAIPDETRTVSKTHARLELRGDTWYVTDLDSTNGVLFATLMGTEVEAQPGQEIEAGERFFLGDAEVRLTRSDG